MKKLTGNINVGVFISGRGSNLKELIKYSKKNNTSWKIKLWQWGWSLMVEKKLTRKITKILMYGVELEPRDKLIKKILLDSSREIMNTIYIDIFVSIASYLSKSPFIIPLIKPENIILTEIDSINSLSDESYIIFIIILEPPNLINKLDNTN